MNKCKSKQGRCLYPKCLVKGMARGLCSRHYACAHLLVTQKKTTWEELVKQGKALAPQSRSKTQKWFTKKTNEN